jgi:hypothetical protein
MAAIKSGNIDTYIKFQDAGAFATNLGSGNATKIPNCETRGFTVGKEAQFGPTKEIYIQRPFSNTTIIHELLHALTHPQFTAKVESSLNEAVPEYFTRKVIHKADDPAFNIEDRVNRYDDHHATLMDVRGTIKKAVAKPDNSIKPKSYMKKAYFQGEMDCIKLINVEADYFKFAFNQGAISSGAFQASIQPSSSAGIPTSSGHRNARRGGHFGKQ